MTYNPPPQQPQGPQPNMPPPPPPGYGGYGGRPAVPAQVNTAAILLFVMGGFAILGGLLLFVVSSLGAIFAVLAVVYLALGGISIWVGVAVRQLKPWARTAALVIAGIVGVLALLSLIKGGFTSIVTLAMAAVVIYMLVQKPVAAVFQQQARS
jgi:hypothetical protein